MYDIPGSNCIYRAIPNQLDYDQAFETKVVHDDRVDAMRIQFSFLWQRTILVHSDEVDAVCVSKIEYLESPRLESGSWDRFIAESGSWKQLEIEHGRQSVLHLQPKTQSVWIQCDDDYRLRNYHLSPIPLDRLNPKMYASKTSKIRKYFGERTPPNILIFVIDSTSRSNFHRSAVSSVQYLTDLMREVDAAPNYVFQHFRY